jgi:hypothetical protein
LYVCLVQQEGPGTLLVDPQFAVLMMYAESIQLAASPVSALDESLSL